ncbi:ankyrin [Gymnopus androsaceus JB14]|uniref:Ankyrin n=1 Tax=Gymnopus androsaceus JB14 TaxID=1447944 RepID=A0A6A4IEP2_9AGAR|nr:ankyrin [Gymnopus androsaceus JB14]
MEPSDSFRDAASYLSNASSLAKVSNGVKLELYGLFKYATVSQNPNVSRPSIFDMTGRAKWDAWDAAGKRYTDGAEAEGRYLEIARDLGWQPGESDPSSEEHGGASGMGVAVSSMAAPETEIDNTLHGLAIAGDVNKLETLISLDRDIDLNALDDFASHIEIVQLLLAKGADSSIKDPDDLTPLELAEIAGREDIAKLLSNR